MRLQAKISLLPTVLLLFGCSQEKETALIVNISALEQTIAQASSLHVDLQQEDAPQAVGQITNKGQPIPLPGSFVIQAEGRQGQAELKVQAFDADDNLLGEGSGSALIQPQQWVETSIELRPSDFQINANYQYDQIFFSNSATETPGRQLASSADGDFVVVWENSADALGRFDIYYRLFDAKGAAKLGNTGSSEERTANKSNEVYDEPAVSMLPDGRFFIAWQRTASGEGISRIFGLPFDQSAALSNSELELSGTDIDGTMQASAPSVASLSDGNYVVVWQQIGAQTCEIKGRLVTAAGSYLPSAYGDGPFAITSFSCPTSDPPPTPMVAGGPSDSFFVTWREQGRIKGAVFKNNAASLANDNGEQIFNVDLTNSGTAKDPFVGQTPYGFAVLWSDGPLSSGQDTSGTAIRLRRFDTSGNPREAQEYTLNTTVEGDQRHPALASNSGELMMAVWTSAPQGSSTGEIRGRRLLGNGLPVGEDFVLGTTEGAQQRHPVVAPRKDDSFIIAFEDASGSGPDTLGSGIRGRLIFPDFSPTGGIGGQCTAGDSSCGNSLSCQSTGLTFGYRCHATCEEQSDFCSEGGQCQKLADGGSWVCLYQEYLAN